MIELDLKAKIVALFELRGLPTLMKVGGVPEAFMTYLIDLQYSIYQLDAFLESNWQLEADTRRACWENIYEKLTACGVAPYDMDEYCDNIYHYETHEMDIRKGVSPSDVPIEKIYYYKSCDVKLIRRLIYEKASKSLVVPLQIWKTFDFITELIDDAEDLTEDLSTYNTNRIIFDIKKYGVEQGLGLYDAFISRTEKEFTALTDTYQEYLFDQFSNSCAAIKDLLNDLRLNMSLKNDVDTAEVFKKFTI